MKRTLMVFLAAVLSVAMLFSFASAAEDSAVGVNNNENRLGAFIDAPTEDSWKFQGLNRAVENGVMNGHENKLRPDDSLTRAEMVAMMVRVLGAYANKADIEHYVDVALGDWYYDTMQSGVAIKIVNGSGNKMMPNAAITREQTFTILARAFLHVEADNAAANKFSDAGLVSDWAKSATNALIESGVVKGDTTNTIRPKADVTRAEFAAMLNRIAGNMSKKDVDYAGQTISGSFILNDSSVKLDGTVIEGDLYITDAVGTDTIDLTNVTVTGRVVIRSGDVNIKAGTSASQIVIGNPTNNTTVKADDGVKVDKVVVAENSNDVVIDIPAEEVVIKSESSEVTIGKDAGNVNVEGKDNTVKVESGATVGKVTVDGEKTNVTGSGKVEDAVINGAGSAVTTPNTNVTDNTKPSGGEDTKPDDGKDDNKPVVGGGGGGSSVAITVNAEKTYISYGDGEEKVYATIDGNTITFDLSELSDSDTAINNLYIKTNKSAKCTSEYFSELSFAANSEVLVADILADMVGSTSGAIAELLNIDLEGGESYTVGNLADTIETAYEFYKQDSFKPIFEGHGIEMESSTNVSFTGKIGTKEFKVVMIVPSF